jgi:hypothetical protein
MDPLVQVINFQRDDMDEDEDGDDSSEVVSEEEDDEDQDEMEHDDDSDDATSRKTTKAPSAYTCGMCGKVRTSITLLQCSLNPGCRPAAVLPIAIMLLVAALRNRPNRDFVLLQFSNSGHSPQIPLLFSSPLAGLQEEEPHDCPRAHSQRRQAVRVHGLPQGVQGPRRAQLAQNQTSLARELEILVRTLQVCVCSTTIPIHTRAPPASPGAAFLTLPLPSTSLPFHLSLRVRRRLRRLLNTLVVVFVLSGPC